MLRLIAFLRETLTPEFWGDIIIRVKGGKPAIIEVHRTYREQDLPPE